jgi:hypothetical protein
VVSVVRRLANPANIGIPTPANKWQALTGIVNRRYTGEMANTPDPLGDDSRWTLRGDPTLAEDFNPKWQVSVGSWTLPPAREVGFGEVISPLLEDANLQITYHRLELQPDPFAGGFVYSQVDSADSAPETGEES